MTECLKIKASYTARAKNFNYKLVASSTLKMRK